MKAAFKQLVNDIQHNCHISDARFAGNYTLCVYLLKMREYYRWESNSGFSQPLSQELVGNWLTQREALWDEIESQDYKPLQLERQTLDPFHSQAINQLLIPHGLVYSGGYGIKSKPHFFIAELEQQQKHLDYTIYISNKEYARDLTAPPAMSHDNKIYIRRESFKRLIWERTEEWRWSKPENAMAQAIACYDFENKPEQALNAMTDNELNNAVLHEIGEIQAGEYLPGWQQMMNAISFTQAEIMARAIRDHLADSLLTLPEILSKHTDNNQQASIHFYFANLTNMRKHLFPSLVNAYQHWQQSGDITHLQNTAKQNKSHWLSLCQKILHLFQQAQENTGGNLKQDSANAIEQLVNQTIKTQKSSA